MDQVDGNSTLSPFLCPPGWRKQSKMDRGESQYNLSENACKSIKARGASVASLCQYLKNKLNSAKHVIDFLTKQINYDLNMEQQNPDGVPNITSSYVSSITLVVVRI